MALDASTSISRPKSYRAKLGQEKFETETSDNEH